MVGRRAKGITVSVNENMKPSDEEGVREARIEMEKEGANRVLNAEVDEGT